MIDNSDIPLEILKAVMPEAVMTPENMPKPEDIQKWDMMVGRQFNRIDEKGNVIQPQVRFEPTNLFPEHDITKNTIKYRFHVRLLFGQLNDKKGLPTEFPRVISDQLVDVEDFLKKHKMV